MWDVFAVSTYFSVSAIFFYIGLIPDIAAVRDRTRGFINKLYDGLSGMAWNRSTMASLHGGIRILRCVCNTSRSLCTLCCILGLRDGANNGMALHTFPTVLRCWSDFLWLCDGNYTSSASFCNLQVGLRTGRKKNHSRARQIPEAGIHRRMALRQSCKMCLLTGGILTYAYGVEHYIGWYSDNVYDGVSSNIVSSVIRLGIPHDGLL